MKKIGLLLITHPHFGGTFQYNQTMLEAVASLPRDRFEVVVGYTSEPWLDYLKQYDVKFVHMPQGVLGRAVGLAWMLLRLPMGMWRRLTPLFHPLAKALLREKCDLWIFPSHDVRGFQFPVPSLFTILDTLHRYGGRFPEAGSNWEYLNREAAYTNICKWAQGVLVVSEIDKQQVLESYRNTPAEKVRVLPMVQPKYLHTTQTPADFELKCPVPPKYFFYPAQFWWHKNHLNLLRAMAKLKPVLPDLKLVLVGSRKNAYDAVIDLMRELNLEDDVIMLGYVPDDYMSELYRRSRALVYASFYGPCNIPPLEALALGCPMALSEVTSMPDRVGGAALVFNPDSVDEIADCMRRLWTDDQLCAELTAKGRERGKSWGQAHFNGRLQEIVAELTQKGDARR